MRFLSTGVERLPNAMDLARHLLRFSDETSGEERGRLAQHGRYSKEAAALAKAILETSRLSSKCSFHLQKGQKSEPRNSGEARYILAYAKYLDGEPGAAAGEFCAALPCLEQPLFEEAVNMARRCAGGEPQLAALVEEDRGNVHHPR